MNEGYRYITDALERLIANDNDDYNGRGQITRIGLYNGTRSTVMAAFARGFDEAQTQWSERLGRETYRTECFAAARTAAVDALSDYIGLVLADEEGERSGEMLTRTLAQSALDHIEWREIVRNILCSCAEEAEGFWQANADQQDEIILAVCRDYMGECDQ
ncbi:MAG: hypothetical protein LC793_24060 [Thermomicrobia bacterium]|nr:hypothetical protein [Thermomicrobia bacterium]